MSRDTTTTSNPWLQPTENPALEDTRSPADPDVNDEDPTPVLTGAAAPHPYGEVPAPADGTPVVVFLAPPCEGIWVVGVHGGSGETTVADLFGGHATDHQWPDRAGELAAPRVLLTARTSARGLQRLQHVATRWAAATLPAVDLLGVVLVADAPGRLPAPLADYARLVTGGLPHTWSLGWHEELRLGEPNAPDSRQIRRTRREIDAVRAALED